MRRVGKYRVPLLKGSFILSVFRLSAGWLMAFSFLRRVARSAAPLQYGCGERMDGEEMIYQNATQYAGSHGVSKQRVMEWIRSGRLSAWRPVSRVYMIDAKAPRPERLKAGRKTNHSKEMSLTSEYNQ